MYTFKIEPEGTSKGRPLLIRNDGHEYSHHYFLNNKQYWRCCKRKKGDPCKASVIEEDGIFRVGSNEHNHKSEPMDRSTETRKESLNPAPTLWYSSGPKMSDETLHSLSQYMYCQRNREVKAEALCSTNEGKHQAKEGASAEQPTEDVCHHNFVSSTASSRKEKEKRSVQNKYQDGLKQMNGLEFLQGSHGCIVDKFFIPVDDLYNLDLLSIMGQPLGESSCFDSESKAAFMNKEVQSLVPEQFDMQELLHKTTEHNANNATVAFTQIEEIEKRQMEELQGGKEEEFSAATEPTTEEELMDLDLGNMVPMEELNGFDLVLGQTISDFVEEHSSSLMKEPMSQDPILTQYNWDIPEQSIEMKTGPIKTKDHLHGKSHKPYSVGKKGISVSHRESGSSSVTRPPPPKTPVQELKQMRIAINTQNIQNHSQLTDDDVKFGVTEPMLGSAHAVSPSLILSDHLVQSVMKPTQMEMKKRKKLHKIQGIFPQTCKANREDPDEKPENQRMVMYQAGNKDTAASEAARSGIDGEVKGVTYGNACNTVDPTSSAVTHTVGNLPNFGLI